MMVESEGVVLELVGKERWKELLLDMIYEGQLNPWDLDLQRLVHLFLQRLNALDDDEEVFFVGGNMILAASIVLKHKAYALDEEQEEVGVVEEEAMPLPAPLSLPRVKTRLRPITLHEVVAEMEKLMVKSKVEKTKVRYKPLFSEAVVMPEEDRLALAKQQLLAEVEEKGVVVIKGGREEIVKFLAALMLFKEGVVNMEQEEEFGEVVVHA